MAAREPVTTLAAIATTYRSNGQKRREVDALLGNPLWSHLTDVVVADVAGVSLRMVRRRGVCKLAPQSWKRSARGQQPREECEELHRVLVRRLSICAVARERA